jgi:hypothetical protein
MVQNKILKSYRSLLKGDLIDEEYIPKDEFLQELNQIYLKTIPNIPNFVRSKIMGIYGDYLVYFVVTEEPDGSSISDIFLYDKFTGDYVIDTGGLVGAGPGNQP